MPRWRDFTSLASELAKSRQRGIQATIDRKSTRLNSSHLVISYAVFCLKKKNDTHVDFGPLQFNRPIVLTPSGFITSIHAANRAYAQQMTPRATLECL